MYRMLHFRHEPTYCPSSCVFVPSVAPSSTQFPVKLKVGTHVVDSGVYNPTTPAELVLLSSGGSGTYTIEVHNPNYDGCTAPLEIPIDCGKFQAARLECDQRRVAANTHGPIFRPRGWTAL